MKRIPFLIALFLVACVPIKNSTTESSSSSAESNQIVMTLVKQTGDDGVGNVRTQASLKLTGAVTQTVPVFNDLGDLLYADPKSYPPPASVSVETVAILSGWWAGQGEEIRITRYRDPSVLAIEHRFGGEDGEEGVCTGWDLIADIPVPLEAEIELEGFTTAMSDQSSLKWCDQQLEEANKTEE